MRFRYCLVLIAFSATFGPGVQSFAQSSANATAKSADGLTTITFSTRSGDISVNLPDDIRPGDTISGTVTADPKGSTPDEKLKNKAVLNAYIVDFSGTQAPVNTPQFNWTPAPLPPSNPKYRLRIVEVLPKGTSSQESESPHQPSQHLPPDVDNSYWFTPPGAASPPDGHTSSGAVTTPDPKITPPSGKPSSGAVVTPDPKITPPPATPSSFHFPGVGQLGKPIQVLGPFGGEIGNTQLSWSQAPSAAPGTAPIPPASAPLRLIAESPRKAIFESPSTATGPIQLRLSTGGVQVASPVRVIGINLSAPKTNLRKGEKTSVTVHVSGLDGITEPIRLQIVAFGPIQLIGGNSQSVNIAPSNVGPGGAYSTTRDVKAVEAGGFTITTTVVNPLTVPGTSAPAEKPQH